GGFETMIAASGWAVLASTIVVETAALESDADRALRTFLASLILGAAPGVTQPTAILLPCGTRGEMPETKAQAMLLAARLGIGEVVAGTTSLRLDDDVRRRLLEQRRLVHGDPVGSFQGRGADSVTVSFRRYRSPVTLRGRAARVFLAAAE